jgi:hypothetical protein
MANIQQAYNVTDEQGNPDIIFRSDENDESGQPKTYHYHEALPLIESGQLTIPQVTAPKGIKYFSADPKWNAQERQEEQGQAAQANKQQILNAITMYKLTPEAAQTLANQHGLTEDPAIKAVIAQQAQKVQGIQAQSADDQARQNFLFGAATQAAVGSQSAANIQKYNEADTTTPQQRAQGIAPQYDQSKVPTHEEEQRAQQQMAAPATPYETRVMGIGQQVAGGAPMTEAQKEFGEAGKEQQMFQQRTLEEKQKQAGRNLNDQSVAPFDESSAEFQIAKKIASENVPVSQWRSLWTGITGGRGAKPRMLSTVLALNPDYNWNENEMNFSEGKSHATAAGKLTPDIISKQGIMAGTKKRAILAPDIQSKQIEQQARGNTAKTLNNQRAAAQRAISTFDDALSQANGKYENIPQWMYRDLASDYAKILVASGQIAEGSVDKVMQMSAQGKIAGMWNYLTGDTKTTAPQKVLQLMHDRIKALSTDLDKQYSNQVQGTNIPVNSDQATNPLRTTKPHPSELSIGSTKVIGNTTYKKTAKGWEPQ